MPIRTVLYLAILGSTFVLAVVAELAAPPARDDYDPVMTGVLYVASVAQLVVSTLLPRIMAKRQLLALDLPTTDTGAANFDGSPVRAFTDPGNARIAAERALMTPFIVRIALREGVSTYGLVVAFMGGPQLHFAPLLALGALMVALSYPSQAGDDAMLASAYGATMTPRV